MLKIQHFFLTVLVALVSTYAHAYDVKIDGIYYNLSTIRHYDENINAYITDYYAYVTHDNNYVDTNPDPTNERLELVGNHYRGVVVIPSTITHEDHEYKVVSINYEAFRNCPDVTSVQLPATIRSIGGSAFYGCSSLRNVNIPSSVTSIEYNAFSGCTSLSSIVIPDGIAYIYDNAFSGCTNLQSVSLPQSLKTIGSSAFSGCSSLQNIDIPGSVTTIESSAFNGCSKLEEVVLPEGITYIASSLFSGCSNLRGVNIPSSVISIRNDAFRNCKSLSQIIIPESVEHIESSTFSGCSSLVSIKLPKNMTEIAGSSFSGCSSLASIDLPEGITNIGNNAFYGCSSLASIDLPEGITNIGNEAFSGCSSLTSIDLPEGITNIGNYAFFGCSSLASIDLPEGITNIGNYAFYGCSSLASIDLQEGITNIGEYAFYGCSSFASIDLQEGITNIGNYAFFGCSSLASITVPQSVTIIGERAFYNCRMFIYNLSNAETGEVGNSAVFTNKDTDGDYAFGFQNDKWYLTEYNGNAKDIVMPNSINGQAYELFPTTSLPKRFPTNIVSIDLGNSITSIPNSYFQGYNQLSEMIIPDQVLSIGQLAFKGCTGLNSVTIGKGLANAGAGVFVGCNNIKTLNYNAVNFKNQNTDNSVYWTDEDGNGHWESKPLSFPSITTLNIGSNVEYIPNNAFRDNPNLTNVVIPDTIKATAIGDGTFSGCNKLPSINIAPSIVTIGDNAFYGCSSLDSICLDSIQTIGDNAFYKCCNLNSICLDNTKTIGSNAFYGCCNLDSICLNNIQSIGKLAFQGCTGLKFITIGKGVANAGAGVFAGCNNIKTLNYNAVNFTNQNTDDYAYWTDEDGYGRTTRTPLSFPSITTLNLGGDVEYIPNSAFANNHNLTGITHVDSLKVKTVGQYAFYDCTNLTSINLGNSLETVGDYAFYGCNNLTSVNLGNSLETVGNYAFTGCNITSLCLGNNINNISSSAFSFNAPLEKLTVGNNYGMNYIFSKQYYDRNIWRNCNMQTQHLVIAKDFSDNAIDANFSTHSLLKKIESNTVEPLAFTEAAPFTEEQYKSIKVKIPEEALEAYKAAPVWELFFASSDDVTVKLYNGNSTEQIIILKGEGKPEEATADNALIFYDDTMEDGAMGNMAYHNEAGEWIADDITLADGKPFYSPANVTAEALTYTRTFGSTDWQALYIPFDMSHDEWTDKAEVAEVMGVHTYDDDNNGTIDRSIIEFRRLKAGSKLCPNTPYVIKPNATGTVTFNCTGKTLAATPAENGSVWCASTRQKYTLIGLYQETPITGNYALINGSFMKISSASPQHPFRFYLTIQDVNNGYGVGSSAQAPSKIRIMVDGEVVTGIDEVQGTAEDGAYYDLSGRRTTTPSRGIYIKNGKKTLIK